jgi:hypothetical protein
MVRKQLLGVKMKAKKLLFVSYGLVFFIALLPKAASARVNFHIGFGSGIGHGYSHVHGGFHYGFHGGHHRWPGSRRHKVFGYRHPYHHKPRHSSGVSVWIGGLFPIVIKPPVVVKSPRVITERQVVIKEPECLVEYDEGKAELFEKLRLQKSNLLKKLRIGDKVKRKEAIRELAGFSFDNKVREALEDILLSDPDSELRRQVAKSFGKTTNKKVLPALEIAESDDPNMEVRQEAYKAIIKIRGYKL